MTATERKKLDRLEDSIETLQQELERLLDEDPPAAVGAAAAAAGRRGAGGWRSMPSVQRARGLQRRAGRGSWAYRCYDEIGKRKQTVRLKIDTKTDARNALKKKLDELRNGPQARQDITVTELVDEYLAQHIAEDNTLGDVDVSAEARHREVR